METNFDQIDRFFEGKPSREKTAEFESRRKEDPEFDREVLLYQQALKMIKAGARDRMKHELVEAGEREYAFNSVRSYVSISLFRKHWLATAASILILVGLGYFGFRQLTPQPGPGQLYAQYFGTPDVSLVMTRGLDTDSLSLVWNEVLQLYTGQHYISASGRLKGLLSNPSFSQKATAHFLLGVCLLKTDQPDSAIYYFEMVSAQSAFYPDAIWYMGLAWLKIGNVPQATALFQQLDLIPAANRKYQTHKILRQLKKTEFGH